MTAKIEFKKQLLFKASINDANFDPTRATVPIIPRSSFMTHYHQSSIIFILSFILSDLTKSQTFKKLMLSACVHGRGLLPPCFL